MFSDKDFQGKDSSYPYSFEYYEKMRKAGWLKVDQAFTTAADNLGEVHLGGSSGSEAVRQARINASDMIKEPKKVRIGNNNVKLNDD